MFVLVIRSSIIMGTRGVIVSLTVSLVQQGNGGSGGAGEWGAAGTAAVTGVWWVVIAAEG